MALSNAEKLRRYRERKKRQKENANELTRSFLKRSFKEYMIECDGWDEVQTLLEWAGVHWDLDYANRIDIDFAHWSDEGEEPDPSPIGRAERMVNLFQDAATALAARINEYKMKEIDARIAEIEQSDLTESKAKKEAFADIVALNAMRDRLRRERRRVYPEYEVKEGD